MARILGHLADDFDVEKLDARTAEQIAKESWLDVQKVEKLKQDWTDPERRGWAVDLVAQALSGWMFVAGVWKVPTAAEAAQAEAMAKAKQEEAVRAARYAAAMFAAAKNGELAKRFAADPEKFRAEKLEEAKRILGGRMFSTEGQKLPAKAPETAVPGPRDEKTAGESPELPGNAQRLNTPPAEPQAKPPADELIAGYTPEEREELARLESEERAG